MRHLQLWPICKMDETSSKIWLKIRLNPQKPGRWNAMHVRIAWEIMHHQKKDNPEKSTNVPNLSKPANAASESLHRPPSHIFPPSSVISRPPDLSASFPPNLPRQFDTASIPTAGFLAGATSHLGKCPAPTPDRPSQGPSQLTIWLMMLLYCSPIVGNAVSPFSRYGSPYGNFPGFTFGREMPMGGPTTLHDPWRR